MEITHTLDKQLRMCDSSGDAHNLSTQVEFANITAFPNDVITYSMTATTNCPWSLALEWGETVYCPVEL